MNLFIATDDGININPFFEEARRFRVLSIINGSVKRDEIRTIKNELDYSLIQEYRKQRSDKSLQAREYYSSDNVCLIITNNISKSAEIRLNENHCEVLLTSETNITNAIMYYLKYHAIQESDYCCCP